MILRTAFVKDHHRTTTCIADWDHAKLLPTLSASGKSCPIWMDVNREDRLTCMKTIKTSNYIYIYLCRKKGIATVQ